MRVSRKFFIGRPMFAGLVFPLPKAEANSGAYQRFLEHENRSTVAADLPLE